MDSRPRGATVFVDGRRIGVTPLRMPEASPGSHAVRLELAGYKPLATTLVVAAGEVARLTVGLEQVAPAERITKR